MRDGARRRAQTQEAAQRTLQLELERLYATDAAAYVALLANGNGTTGASEQQLAEALVSPSAYSLDDVSVALAAQLGSSVRVASPPAA